MEILKCGHKKQIAEREFYLNQKYKFSGTRIICLTCGENKFIKDKKSKLKTKTIENENTNHNTK